MHRQYCSMCFFSTTFTRKFISHVVRTHRHDPNFSVTCTFPNCSYSTKSWNAYKTHSSRKHNHNAGSIIDDEPQNDRDSIDNDQQNDPQLVAVDGCEEEAEHETDPEIFAGKYTLALSAAHNVAQDGIDSIIATTSSMINDTLELYTDRIIQQISDGGPLDRDTLRTLMPQDMFIGLSTHRKRQKFYEERFGLLNPEPVYLGSKVVSEKGKCVRKRFYGYIVPFETGLQAFLEMPEIWNYVSNPHFSASDVMLDICDGRIYRSHPLFSRNVNALQIILNCDDIEIVNPIGSHTKKHKLSMFYWTLGNIPPISRSRLSAIQLLGVVKTRDIREYGIDMFLKDFTDTTNRLSQGGIQMTIHGSLHKIEGALLLAPCDTLAAQWLGGFKEGVSFALKGCRTCNASKKQMRETLLEGNFILRDEEEHRQRCHTLEGLSKQSRTYWSKMWGINSRSALLDLTDFPICKGLVQDPMHLLQEGLLRYELQLLLYHCIYVEGFFTLETLNALITSFKYSYTDIKNRPSPIEKAHIFREKLLQQTAAATLTLCLTLPYMIGQYIPIGNVKWENFLRLLLITNLCLSPSADLMTVAQLDQMIHTHHIVFKREYPTASVIPKMHYLMHLPQQILNYGPGRYHWCMRFEAKHGYFKTKKWRCFKNLPLSIANKHQMHMCYSAAAGQALNYLYPGDVVREGLAITFSAVYPDLLTRLGDILAQPDIDLATVKLYQPKSVQIHGHEYQTQSCLRLDYDDGVPQFCIVKDILVFQELKIFVIEKAEVEDYDSHVIAYILKLTNTHDLVTYQELDCKWPLPMYTYKHRLAVINQFATTCELL